MRSLLLAFLASVTLTLAAPTYGQSLRTSSPTRASLTSVTLGSSRFYAPASKGFGTMRPAEIFNGGDPSGLVTGIHWSSWGGSTAVGAGLNAIFKPQGGYYRQLVRIDLTARDRGMCPGSTHLAYRQLWVREPKRPGGPLGSPFLWSGAHDLCASSP
jgi:hypothetical protein